MLVCLLAVRYISLISVIGNVALALVTATISFRIYKSVLAAVNKSSEGHPFRQFMDSDVALPADKVSQLTDSLVNRMNNTLAKLKSIFLLTYVGAILNGLTVLILAWVGLFSLPPVYRDNQKQIDDAVLPLMPSWRSS